MTKAVSIATTDSGAYRAGGSVSRKRVDVVCVCVCVCGLVTLICPVASAT